MKALSIRQPWAWLIVTGFKDIENRTWRTKFRGDFYIHAGAQYSRVEHDRCAVAIEGLHSIVLPSYELLKQQTGAICGRAILVDCVAGHASRWKDEDSFGFVLADAQRLRPVPCKGMLGFFDVKLIP